jgi:hypothetical protein
MIEPMQQTVRSPAMIDTLATFDLNGLGTGSSHEASLGTLKADGGRARSGRSTWPKRGKCEETMPQCNRTPFLTARTSVTTASAGRSSAAEKTPASSVAAGTFDAAIRFLPHHLQVSKTGS